MKKLILCAALLAACHSLRSQTLNVTASGWTGTSLFQTSTGFSLGGLDVDSSGNIYYLEVGPNSATSTRLYMRTAADYSTAIPLFDFGGTRRFGSFVRLHGGDIYFGESSVGTIWRGTLNGTSPITPTAYDPDSTPATADYTFNYDFTFDGNDAYLVRDASNAEPHIYKFDIGTGVVSAKVDASGEYAGPVASNGAGKLYYGGSGLNADFSPGAANIYGFDTASLTGSEVPLTSGTLLFDNGSNSYLTVGAGNQLFEDNFSSLRLYDVGASSVTVLGSATGGSFLGNLTFAGSTLYVTTSVGSNASAKSAVYSVTPEPASGLLAGLGAACLAIRRRRN